VSCLLACSAKRCAQRSVPVVAVCARVVPIWRHIFSQAFGLLVSGEAGREPNAVPTQSCVWRSGVHCQTEFVRSAVHSRLCKPTNCWQGWTSVSQLDPLERSQRCRHSNIHAGPFHRVVPVPFRQHFVTLFSLGCDPRYGWQLRLLHQLQRCPFFCHLLQRAHAHCLASATRLLSAVCEPEFFLANHTRHAPAFQLLLCSKSHAPRRPRSCRSPVRRTQQHTAVVPSAVVRRQSRRLHRAHQRQTDHGCCVQAAYSMGARQAFRQWRCSLCLQHQCGQHRQQRAGTSAVVWRSIVELETGQCGHQHTRCHNAHSHQLRAMESCMDAEHEQFSAASGLRQHLEQFSGEPWCSVLELPQVHFSQNRQRCARLSRLFRLQLPTWRVSFIRRR
jgi:hypothetical protein